MDPDHSICFETWLNIPSLKCLIQRFYESAIFLCGFGFRPYVSAESGIRIRNFLNPLSRVEIFEYAMNPESCGR